MAGAWARAIYTCRMPDTDLPPLFEQLPIGVYRSTLGGRQLRANAALVRLNGYASEAELLAAVQDIASEWYVEPGRRDEFARLLARDGRVIDFVSEARRHRTRERIWVRETAHLVRDAAGQPLCYEGTVQDITAEHEAQLALQASERRFRALTDRAQVLTLVCDPVGRVLYASQAALALLGRAPQALLGEFLFDWMHPDDRDLARAEFGEVVQRCNPGVESLYRLHHADGSWRHVAALGQSFMDDPAVRGIVLNWRDVTEREGALQAMRQSQQRFQAAFAVSPDALLISRLSDGLYLEVNDTFVELSGYRRDELIGRNASELNIWADESVRRYFRAELARQGRVRHFEAHFQGRGDRRGVVEISAEPIEVDGEPCLMTIARDITQRLQAEQALRGLTEDLERRVGERTRQLADSERRYRSIFELVPMAIVEEDWSEAIALLAPHRAAAAADPHAWLQAQPALVATCLQAIRLVRLNPAAAALYGLHADDDAPHRLAELFAMYDSAEGFVDELTALLAGRRRHDHARTLRRADGELRHVQLALALPTMDPGGDGTALASLVDVTELQRLSAELDASLAEARRAHRELETFTYSVSHDLKAPLRGLDGYSQLLLSRHAAQLDEEGQHFLQRIRGAAQQMAQLTDDLLAYARLERRTQALGAVGLGALVKSVLADCADERERRGVVLTLDLPVVTLRADVEALKLALRNLVDNALKFSTTTPTPVLAIGAEGIDGRVRLWVRDNGVGFDMGFHDRIFQIFQRLHRAEDYPGTGVGLAIVAKAMERMGGRAWAESAPGQGATFYLELPQA
ncbi:MAG: hypothetical protein A3E25_18045 [Burkholderiales bacterium RIFCSPHIGHO2_12_FULL_69_20]|nr:MAG: hypothetical protein A3E25_18045 [Burkholderiales bacterium RIFCSPHIGHO2_12_FULL_69_20]